MSRFRLLRLLSGLRNSRKQNHSALKDFLVTELDIVPNDMMPYQQAFLHVTAVDKKIDSNERLEFVGDAILDAIVAAYAFNKFPDHDEGFLSKIKSAVVNRQTLNKLARDMQLERWIDAGSVNNRQAMHVIGGNTLEALIGAIYQDRGYEEAERWVRERIIKKLDVSKLKSSLKDPKSTLYELAHKLEAKLEFVIENPEHDTSPPFVASVVWNGDKIASAESSSKKNAEQKAAKKALIGLTNT